MWSYLRQDIARCGPNRLTQLKNMLLLTGMWAIFGYRFRRWMYTSPLPRPLLWPMKPIAILLHLGAQITSNVEIPNSAEIDAGVLIPHTGYVVVGAGAVIGRHCTLTQGVTIGHARGGPSRKSGSPVVGNRVYFGPGSAAIGPITIGDDALIGVGAVVIKSVPARAVVVGNPARVISYSGSFSMISYPGMMDDPARNASLEARNETDEDTARQDTHSIQAIVSGRQ